MCRRILLTVLLCGLAQACDADDPEDEAVEDDYLGRDAVTSIPLGDAVGDAFSGDYQARATTVSCVGECSPVTIGGTTYSVCERDAETVEWVTVYQQDGVLQVDLDDDGHIGINLNGYVPVRLHGGIDADGSWDVGGVGTKFGRSLESTARARGMVRPDEPFEGTVEVKTVGVVEGTEVDCHTTHRLVSL